MFEQPFTQPADLPAALPTETLQLQQIAQDFRREVEARQTFEHYCQWYDQTAAANQKALAAMGQELDILSWFTGFRWRG